MVKHKKARKGAKSEEETDRQRIRIRSMPYGNIILSSVKKTLKLQALFTVIHQQPGPLIHVFSVWSKFVISSK